MLVNPDFLLNQIFKISRICLRYSPRAWRRDLKSWLIGIALLTDKNPPIRSSTERAFSSPPTFIQWDDEWCTCKSMNVDNCIVMYMWIIWKMKWVSKLWQSGSCSVEYIVQHKITSSHSTNDKGTFYFLFKNRTESELRNCLLFFSFFSLFLL